MCISILKNKTIINPSYTLYRFENADIASVAKPGQFVEVRVPGYRGFRKPISVFNVCDQFFDLLIKTVGVGTDLLTKLPIETEVEISTALGNGFSISPTIKNHILVGGGIGLAPLNYLAKAITSTGNKATLLFSSKRDEELLNCFDKEAVDSIIVAENRDDAAEKLRGLLDEAPCESTCVYSCGPNPFMKMVSDIAANYDIDTQVSLETRMSCGMGICLGCIVNHMDAEGNKSYKTVCHDGPVFIGKEVFFE